jgi:hypothetical protein
MNILKTIIAITIAFPAAPGLAENAVVPGELVIERPTLICLGFQWYTAGDDNKNARATVKFRRAGDTEWKAGLDLWRLNGQRCISYHGDGKGSSYEGGQRVPCVMRWPAKIAAGTDCTELATAMDFLPTFAELTGAKLPPGLKLKPDGHDIQNLMMGGTEEKTPYDMFYFSGNQAVRAGEWKYRNGRRYGHWSGVRAKENPMEKQLFNLADDPGETNNLVEKYPERVSAYSNSIVVGLLNPENKPRLLVQASHAYRNNQTNIWHFWIDKEES